jgi:pseudouridine synthase
LGSRRYCETLIAEQRVKVNGKVADQPGIRVDPIKDRISVDEAVIEAEPAVYFLLNKPRGFICSHRPRRDQKSAIALVRAKGGERLFCVGRLDEDSEGALILTNDGEFCNQITHPRYGISKTYRVTVRGRADGQMMEKVRKGIYLAEGKTAPAEVQITKRLREASLLRVTLREGRNRHLRRIFARVGLPVLDICRIAIGPLMLGRMKPGTYRELKPAEIALLRDETRHPRKRSR